ncbi:hypothetical protein GIB67_042914 [Kingdonia uniflora]|uniref:Uncharacterized protein n=1 Tax=Kingdonia uniflora TaxID=39325 RepID=A0A7J7P2R2_9MAGN|nr:hypothetical protein GIB67_042914 [Kingdonia uniflora]
MWCSHSRTLSYNLKFTRVKHGNLWGSRMYNCHGGGILQTNRYFDLLLYYFMFFYDCKHLIVY